MAELPDPLNNFEYEFPDDDIGLDDGFPGLAKASCVDNASSSGSLKSHSSSNFSKTRFLWNIEETIEVLRPEQVRWFYREIGNKSWIPFIGYDSLRIECKYREVQHSENKSKDSTHLKYAKEERICVRGSLYEVSVTEKKCYPIYWHHEGTSRVCMNEKTYLFISV